MESLDGTTARNRSAEESKEWMQRTNIGLQLLGVFLLINGIYFALFTTDIYTALVYYSFVLMVVTGISYCYWFTADDFGSVLETIRTVAIGLREEIDLPTVRSTPRKNGPSERRRL